MAEKWGDTMCGIFVLWNREGKFPIKVVEILFQHAEKRGFDGVGYAILKQGKIGGKKYPDEKYSDRSGEILSYLDFLPFNLLIGICRAQPETETDSSYVNMQPIAKEHVVLVHNGSVSGHIVKKYNNLGYLTQIDSEAIINCYFSNERDMQKTMEDLVGGFAFILYDQKKNRLYCVNDFKPLAVGYFRGYGFIVHSSLDALKEVSNYLIGTQKTGINVWEDYYFHWQEGYTIREIDLDSGMQRIYNFTPNFYHPTWNPKTHNNKELCLVICSGGIDSSLTAYILKLVGYNVKLVHFLYGQKGQETESLAVKKLSKWMQVPVYWVDLQQFYNQINDPSMLIREEIPIETGKEDIIKTTAAWVSARNLIFLAKTITIAETEILRENWKKVYIAAGLSQLSEEGFYPDNSEYFIKSFFETAKYGTITSHRIFFLPLFKNIMKYEEWILGNALNFRFELTCSCDNPKVINGEIYLCRECGSTRLSMFASQMAGIKDPRKFYGKESEEFIQLKSKDIKTTSPIDIINRLILPPEEKQILIEMVSGHGNSTS